MQMVLTLQFSAALELTNDGGLGKVAMGARSMSGQNMAWDNHQGNGLENAMESGALEPQALHFADVQLLA